MGRPCRKERKTDFSQLHLSPLCVLLVSPVSDYLLQPVTVPVPGFSMLPALILLFTDPGLQKSGPKVGQPGEAVCCVL